MHWSRNWWPVPTIWFGATCRRRYSDSTAGTDERSRRTHGPYDAPRHPVLSAKAGGLSTVTGGNGPSQRSTSTSLCCAVVPCDSFDDGRSAVSTFGFPCRQKDGSGGSGSYHAPVESWTTPGRNASDTSSPARQ